MICWPMGSYVNVGFCFYGKARTLYPSENDWNELTYLSYFARCRQISTQVSKISNKNQISKQKNLQQSTIAYNNKLWNIVNRHATNLIVLVDNNILIIIESMQLLKQDEVTTKELGVYKQQLKNLTSSSRQLQYNALKDKFAFGYFQNNSVQLHLRKMLKNMKDLPPSSENRKIIGTISEKIMKPQNHSKHQSLPIQTQKVQIKSGKNNRSISVVEVKDKSQQNIDALYPYKENLQLKSFRKFKEVIQKKERELRRKQKDVSFPRLQTVFNQNQHQKIMQKLIERQNRQLQGKKIIVNRLKHKQFSKFINQKEQSEKQYYSKVKF